MKNLYILIAILISSYSCSSESYDEIVWPLPTDINIVEKNYYYNEYGEQEQLEIYDKYRFIVAPESVHWQLRDVENKTANGDIWQCLRVFNNEKDSLSYESLCHGLVLSDSLNLCDTIYYYGPIYRNPGLEGGAIVFTNNIYVYLNKERDMEKLYEVADYFKATIHKRLEVGESLVYVLEYNNGFHGLSSVSVANYIHETGLFKRAVALKYIHPMTY